MDIVELTRSMATHQYGCATMAKTFLLTLSILVAAILPGNVSAQECLTRQQVSTQLANKFGETLSASGVSERGFVLEVYRSITKGTWTLVLVQTNNCAHPVASGQGWVRFGVQES